MKPCTRCKQLKTLDLFPRAKRAKDGRASRCNACMSEILAIYKATPEGSKARKKSQDKWANSPKGRATRSAFGRRPDQRQKRAEYARTPKGREIMKKCNKKYVRNLRKTTEGRLKLQAISKVKYATERGDIPPIASLECESCPQSAEHYHHDLGYARRYWLHIVPLCCSCHHKIHFPDVR